MTEDLFYFHYDFSALGEMTISATNKALREVSFRRLDCEGSLKETDLLRKAAQQLCEYFSGKRQVFDLPVDPQGTEFQQRVWKELQKIPYGETRSYGQIAKAANCPKGCRAVGMANNHNPIAIIIPCHRVIGANGKLVGYAGGLEIKQYLLALEQK